MNGAAVLGWQQWDGYREWSCNSGLIFSVLPEWVYPEQQWLIHPACGWINSWGLRLKWKMVCMFTALLYSSGFFFTHLYINGADAWQVALNPHPWMIDNQVQLESTPFLLVTVLSNNHRRKKQQIEYCSADVLHQGVCGSLPEDPLKVSWFIYYNIALYSLALPRRLCFHQRLSLYLSAALLKRQGSYFHLWNKDQICIINLVTFWRPLTLQKTMVQHVLSVNLIFFNDHG